MIKYIDYDLDAKLFTDKEIKLLDEKEYLRHKEFYHYSDELDQVLRYSIKSVVNKMKNGEFPFDDNRVRKYYDKFLDQLNKDK